MDIAKVLADVRKEHETPRSTNSRVLVVDGLNAFKRAFSVTPTLNDDGEHIGGITGFFTTLTYAIKLTNPTRCVIVFDGKGGSVRRKKIFPEYKENRRGLRLRLNRKYDFTDHDDEYKSAMKQLIRISEYLEHLPITSLMIDNVEADDVIGYISKEYYKEEVVIMSNDRDFIPLVDERISIWNATRKKLYTPELIYEDYGFTPNNYLLFRLVDGDKGDNIPGVKGVGIKTVEKNICSLTGSQDIEVHDFFNMLEENKEDNKVAQKLYDHLDDLKRNYVLMQLDNVDISGSIKSKIRELLDVEVSIMNKTKFKLLFLEDKLYHSIPNLDSWLLVNFNTLNTFALQTQN